MSQFFINGSGGGGGGGITSITTNDGTVIPAAGNVIIIGDPGLSTRADPDGSNELIIFLTNIASSYTNVTSAMSPYTVTATDYYISVDASGGAVTINLPDAPFDDKQYIIKDRLGTAQTNNITVKSLTGAATIDGQATYVFNDNYESLECLFHGSNYEGF